MLFLQSNYLISQNQFGFMSRRSTCSQLLATLNDWTLAVNNHAKVDAVHIDFDKAFDSISHAKLLTKIRDYGIDTNLLNWISNVLSERTQSVYIGNTFSKFLPVLSGVPQGSVLCPLLFLQMTQKCIVPILSINLLYLQIACHLFVIGQNNGNLLSLITNVFTFVLDILKSHFPNTHLVSLILVLFLLLTSNQVSRCCHTPHTNSVFIVVIPLQLSLSTVLLTTVQHTTPQFLDRHRVT